MKLEPAKLLRCLSHASTLAPSEGEGAGVRGKPAAFHRSWCLMLLWSLVLGAWSFSPNAPAADTNTVLSGWFNAQKQLQSWSADFTQTRALKTLTQPLTATGRIWFAPPNRFRWELGQPPRTIALRSTDEMFVVYPRLKRAEKYPLGGQKAGEWRDLLSLLDAGFPKDRAEFDRQFRVVSLSKTNQSFTLALEPRSAFARKMITEIRVQLATNDFSLTANELVFMDGSRMRNDFTNAVLNAPLDADRFTWQPEPGYKITEPMGK